MFVSVFGLLVGAVMVMFTPGMGKSVGVVLGIRIVKRYVAPGGVCVLIVPHGKGGRNGRRGRGSGG